MSLDDKEIKKRLAQSDENVAKKISNEGADAQSIKNALDEQKNENNRSALEDENVEDLENIDDKIDENTPNPT